MSTLKKLMQRWCGVSSKVEELSKGLLIFLLGKNNKIYLFSGNRYWRFSESRKMDFFYPRIIKTWRGVPMNVTGAVSFADGGPTIFFKNDEFLIYDDAKVKPKSGFPKKIRELLPNCR